MSSLRLRKALVIRSYNLRATDESMEDQFRHLSHKGDDGRDYISLEDVKTYLGFHDGSTIESTYRRLLGGTLRGRKFLFNEFLEFLDTGSIKSAIGGRTGITYEHVEDTEGSISSKSISSNGSSKLRQMKGIPPPYRDTQEIPGKPKPLAPPSPETLKTSTNNHKSKHERALEMARGYAEADFSSTNDTYDGGALVDDGEEEHSNTDDYNGHNGTYKLRSNQSTSSQRSENESPSVTSSKEDRDIHMPLREDLKEHLGEDMATEYVVEEMEDSYDRREFAKLKIKQEEEKTRAAAGVDTLIPHPSLGVKPGNSNVWRKREVVTQTRAVYYTTVDEDGVLQELVEEESNTKEVLHMESRETGEFAHRETTTYEQSEKFNNEVVGEQKGKEEYVHLKSQDDEFECMNSDGMPPQSATGDAPQSPRVGGDGQAGQSGDEGIDRFEELISKCQEFAATFGVSTLDEIDMSPLDEDTISYVLYLKSLLWEAERKKIDEQIEELCRQLGVIEQMTEEELDDETRVYHAYLKDALEKCVDRQAELLAQKHGPAASDDKDAVETKEGQGDEEEEELAGVQIGENGENDSNAGTRTMNATPLNDEIGEGEEGEELSPEWLAAINANQHLVAEESEKDLHIDTNLETTPVSPQKTPDMNDID